jgi:hypothetical protein
MQNAEIGRIGTANAQMGGINMQNINQSWKLRLEQ